MEQPFDEAHFRQTMIDGGLDPETATEVARHAAQSKQPVPVDANSPAKKKTASVSKSTSKLIDTGLKIREEPPDGDDMTFMHSIMCQVGLPRSKVDGLEFERVCGAAGLHVRAGKLWNGKEFVQQQLPYGPLPRLIMAYMNTQALRSQSPEIEVGNSARDMLLKLGIASTGGRTGTLTNFRKQTQALAACTMTIGFAQAERAITYDGRPIKKFDAWISQDEHQPALWPGVVTLSEEYYGTLKGHAVPLDLRALMALKGSALSMDIYAMLAERLHRLGPRPLILHWKSLREQFGQEFQGKEADKDFKKEFLPALRRVLEVYPEARVKQVTGGVMLTASPPPIPYKPS